LIFAKVWQNRKRAPVVDLPMFGKFGRFLPNIGKIQNRPFAAGVGNLPMFGKFP